MADEKRAFPVLVKAGMAAYLFLCLIVFVAVRFPYDVFRGRLEEAISSFIRQPVTLGRIRSGFPFGLKVEGMSIDKDPFARELRIDPNLVSLLSGRLSMDIDAVFPSGSLAGRVRTPLGAGGGTLGISARMDGLDARTFHPLFSSELRPKGVLSGSVELDGPSASLREMGGKANIVWENGYLPLPVPLLPMDGIEFTTLRIDSVMEKGLLTLQKVELAGDVSGTVQGSVRIMEPLSRSRLNLTGELTLPPDIALIAGSPQRPASERMRFSLRGTVERPRFRILNR